MKAAATLVAGVALLPPFTVSAQGPSGGQVIAGVIPGGPRPALVYLPPAYGASDVRYPVVYLLHGLPGSPSEYIDGAQLLTFADTEIKSGRMQPFIAVMPSAGTSHAYRGEWAGNWERYVVDDVVPWADTHFRTLRDPAARTIAGLSAGGFGAVDIALHSLRMFGTAESWSGYFTPLHDTPFTHASLAVLRANDPTLLVARDFAAIRRARLRFYVSTGPTHDHVIPSSETIAFANLLHRLRIPVSLSTYRLRRGEWRAQVQAGLTWAFGSTPQSST